MMAIVSRYSSSKTQYTSFLLTVLLIFFCCSAEAKVSGHCSNCHTMHNSQHGSILVDTGPNQALLKQDCIGCHTGDNSTLSGANAGPTGTPYVHYTDNADYYNTSGIEGTTLAGGTFHFIDIDGATGHNVAGIDNTGGPGINPPGYASGLPDSADHIPGGGSWDAGQQVTCSGTYGCHGNHNTENQFAAVRGAHHQGVNGTEIDPGMDTTPAMGYRMLVGIAGYEDSDWEYKPDSSHHNQYKGSSTPGQVTDRSTISYLCAQCHGQFHSPVTNLSNEAGGGSPWLRHPTEYSMKASGEYGQYGGDSHTYLPATPLASTSVNNVVATITFTNDSIVNCLSCHRAHGSAYYKSMRWNYAGLSGSGLCVNCHTSKD